MDTYTPELNEYEYTGLCAMRDRDTWPFYGAHGNVIYEFLEESGCVKLRRHIDEDPGTPAGYRAIQAYEMKKWNI